MTGTLIAPHLKPLHLPHGAIFYKAEGTIERVYFPHAGIVSLDRGAEQRASLSRPAVLGSNGVIGAGAALGRPRLALNTAISQAEGAGTDDRRLRAETAGQGKRGNPHCIGAPRTRSGGSDAAGCRVQCTARAGRAAEPLAPAITRSAESDTLPLTQEFLAQMLGVQRSSVTLVARKLQASRLDQLSPWSHPRARCRRACRTAVANVTARSTAHFSRLDRLVAGKSIRRAPGTPNLEMPSLF